MCMTGLVRLHWDFINDLSTICLTPVLVRLIDTPALYTVLLLRLNNTLLWCFIETRLKRYVISLSFHSKTKSQQTQHREIIMQPITCHNTDIPTLLCNDILYVRLGLGRSCEMAMINSQGYFQNPNGVGMQSCIVAKRSVVRFSYHNMQHDWLREFVTLWQERQYWSSQWGAQTSLKIKH